MGFLQKFLTGLRNKTSKKSPSSPPEWVEEIYEPTFNHTAVIHHLCYGFPKSTIVPSVGYPISDDLMATAVAQAKKAVEEMNLQISDTSVLDSIITLTAIKEVYSSIANKHINNVLQIYRDWTDLQTQLDEINSYISIRESQLSDIRHRISLLET